MTLDINTIPASVGTEFFYKIMDLENGALKTLFHGVDGCRAIPQFEWVKAIIRPVSDGSSSTVYHSGFHVLETQAQCEKYLERFRNLENKVIVKCRIGKLRWHKEHSPADGLWLAEYLFLFEVVKIVTL
jgi:hypothetical protein